MVVGSDCALDIRLRREPVLQLCLEAVKLVSEKLSSTEVIFETED
jgi:hypothetical protein